MSSTPFLDPAACLLPAPTGTEAAAFDAAAARRGASGAVLMESAGRAAADVAQRLLERAGRRGPVVVAAGAGKNGGDGVVLARTLHARGIPVVLLVDPRRPDPDPLLHGHPVPVHPLPGGGRTEGGDARPGPPRPSDGTGTGTGTGTGSHAHAHANPSGSSGDASRARPCTRAGSGARTGARTGTRSGAGTRADPAARAHARSGSGPRRPATARCL